MGWTHDLGNNGAAALCAWLPGTAGSAVTIRAVSTEPPRGSSPLHAPTRVVFGIETGIASVVYGTVVVMATLTAAYASEKDPWRLAGIVVSAVVVLWIAHVYAHGLSETIASRTQLRERRLASIARHELGIVLAAIAPCGVLVLGALGVLRESSAVWLALAVGLLTLAVEGLRYARLEGYRLAGTLAAIGVNLALGLFVVGLKVLVAH